MFVRKTVAHADGETRQSRTVGWSRRPTLALDLVRQLSLPALTAQLIWGLNVSATKFALGELDPYLMAAVRMLIAGLILFVVLALGERSVWVRPDHWPRLALIGVLGTALSVVLWLFGLSRTTASTAALLSNTSPVFALVMAVALGQEVLVRRRVVGMGIAFLGVLLVVQADGLSLADDALLGDLLLLGSSVCWAGYNVFGVLLLRHYSPLKVTAWGLIFGSIGLMLLSPLGVQSWDVHDVSGLAWLGFGYTIVMGTIVAQTLWSRTVKALGASGTMIYSYLMPVIAISLAAALLGERVTPIQLVGAVLVLAGVTISSYRRQARRRESPSVESG